MGYTTTFDGQIEIVPPLNEQERDFLTKFAETRRMARGNGPYYVDGGGSFGQAHEEDVINHNKPPEGQPGLWCQWRPIADGSALEWDGGEKFYNAPEWMKYIIDHFMGDDPIAKKELPFLQSHTLGGIIEAQGEDPDDKWRLIVRGNKVYKQKAYLRWSPNEEEV